MLQLNERWYKFKILLKTLLSFTFLLFCYRTYSAPSNPENEKTFRLHISSEPLSLDPSQQKGTGSMFLFNSIHLPLFKSNLNQRFKPGVFQECQWKKPIFLSCLLVADLKWSNGKPLDSSFVKKSFEYFMDPKTKNKHPQLFENIKQVLAPTPSNVEFILHNEEPRFQEKLTSPLLSPIYSSSFPKLDDISSLITAGPYKILQWISKNKITLAPNPFYHGHPKRPNIEFYFISEEATALTLYENNQLDFLRRLPTSYIDRYRASQELHQIPLMKLDYIGFGPALDNEPELRKQLSLSLDYHQWGQFLRALGRPGCFGISQILTKSDPCLNFESSNLSTWKRAISSRKSLPSLALHYSTLGGEDHKKSMEWIQNQWKINLGLTVIVKGVNNNLFQKEIHEAPPPLFRIGVSLDHLSCYNALESFFKSSAFPINFKQKNILEKLSQFGKLKPNDKSEENFCHSILSELLANHWIIPMGRIQASFLVKPGWKGWTLSPLNVLDLSDLHYEK